MPDLSRVGDREGLKVRREPHWQRLRPGCFLGYRPSTKGGAGTWIARAYDGESRGYKLRSLGSFGEEPSKERFGLAKVAAEAFAIDVERGGLADEKVETVEDVCRLFAKKNKEASARFKRYVYSDPLAKVKLAKLRRNHLLAWRARVEETPALVSRRKKGERLTRPRSPATLNRDMAVLRTALGSILPLGAPNTESAWQEALRPIRNAVKRRTLYLSRDERRALIGAVNEEAGAFVQTLCLLPLRPGAVAALTVADFDKQTSELTIGKDKSGNQRRIVVPTVAAGIFKSAAKNKLPATHLFTRSNGKPWNKETWNDPIAEAAKATKLPAAVTAYTLRHSTITDLVTGGLPLLTVAQISGTSADMIEKHYGHLVRGAAVEALASLAL